MKRVFLLALLLTLALATVSHAALPPARGFAGAWTSIDVDGSHQRLVIQPVRRPWGTYSLAYFDDGASVCGCDAAGKPLYPGMGLLHYSMVVHTALFLKD
ncbi:MAG: hypothetical protein FJ026_15705 [Chloroflexi bacterium]|nr:hypothetical protein [Chloroflexota bacterium]